MNGSLRLVPDRTCGSCNVCCIVPKIDEPELRKPPGCRCPNAREDGSCAIYEQRPQTCRNFYCGWRLAEWIDDALRPDQSGIFIRFSGDPTLVSGDHPFAMVVTVRDSGALDAPGLIEALVTAIQEGVSTFLIVPGPPGYTSCRVPLNRILKTAVECNDFPAVRAALGKTHAHMLTRLDLTYPVVLRQQALNSPDDPSQGT